MIRAILFLTAVLTPTLSHAQKSPLFWRQHSIIVCCDQGDATFSTKYTFVRKNGRNYAKVTITHVSQFSKWASKYIGKSVMVPESRFRSTQYPTPYAAGVLFLFKDDHNSFPQVRCFIPGPML